MIEKQVIIKGKSFRILEQGEGPAVLFCHGFPDIADTWKHQISALADNGYRAIAIDMRGFGGSYAPKGYKLYSAKHIAKDLVGLLETLNIQTAALVGHDWGADHAQRIMLLHPDRFKALVSLSIPFTPRGDISYWDLLRENGLEDKYYAFELMKNQSEDMFQPIDKTWKNMFYWLSGRPEKGTGWNPIEAKRNIFRVAPDDALEWVNTEYQKAAIHWFENTGFQTGINHYRAMQTTFDETLDLKNRKVNQPSLYIWGKEDGLCQFFHPELSSLAELQKSHPGLIKQVALDNVGHWPQHEAADKVSGEIISFLNKFKY